MSLARFVLRRVLQGLFVIWGVITVVFALRFVTPGSPVDAVAPLDASPELRARIAQELGLDQPIYVQYVDYLFGLLQGDMGYSYISGTPAAVRVFARLPATIELAVAATLVALVFSIPLGVISATRRHKPADYAATSFSLVGISTPNFWLGIMLILIVSVNLGLLPTSRRPIGLLPALELLVFQLEVTGVRTWIAHMILPALTLGTYFTALIVRLTRSGMLDELGKSYVRATRAKGLPETLVRYKHVLRNTLIPIVTILGLQLGTLIGGAVITEFVFSWPGLGTLVINAITSRDWTIIQGSLIVIGAGFVIVNTAVDVLYATINPQVIYD
ncbi:ABC transporter permease [Natronorarus salvus]|uniref:ABC transporter permease n=1 Tax=Natronorarus salvus TaxID=3117733 RepID=UPI002F25FBF6